MNNVKAYMSGFLSVYLYISIYKHTQTMCETVILMKMSVPVVIIISVVELHTENIFVRFTFFIFQTSEISICSIYHKPAIYRNKSGNELLTTDPCLLMRYVHMLHSCTSKICQLPVPSTYLWALVLCSGTRGSSLLARRLQ